MYTEDIGVNTPWMVVVNSETGTVQGFEPTTGMAPLFVETGAFEDKRITTINIIVKIALMQRALRAKLKITNFIMRMKD